MNDPKSPGGSMLQKRTLVEEGTRFKGSLSSTCPMLHRDFGKGGANWPANPVCTGPFKLDAY